MQNYFGTQGFYLGRLSAYVVSLNLGATFPEIAGSNGNR